MGNTENEICSLIVWGLFDIHLHDYTRKLEP